MGLWRRRDLQLGRLDRGPRLSHGTYEVASNADKDNLDIVEATGRYDLGPGISLDAMVGFNDYNNDNGSGTRGGGGDNKTWEAGLGFFIGF